MVFATLSTRASAKSPGADSEVREVLNVTNLRTWFHTKAGIARAVDGVDLNLGRGGTLGLIGESGCGKSATALSIMGLIDAPGRIEPGSSIRFDDKELVGCSEDALAAVRGKEIGMIFQEPMSSLNPVYTVGYQIAEAVLAHDQVSRSEARTRAIDLLALVRIPHPELRIDLHPHQMSGGMRQRVMIAIALACRPQLLIADEPTTSLDVTVQAQIIALLAELRESLGMAVLLITHDLGIVSQLADEVAVMYAGRVIERGSIGDVFSSPRHPYTEALLQSIPTLGMRQDNPLKVIRGAVPSPLAWPSGCRFAPRCDYVFEQCRQRYPEMAPLGALTAACWLNTEASLSSNRLKVLDG